MASTETAWTSLKGRIAELEALEGVIQLLEWDQQTMMPSGGAPHRGNHLSTLSGLMHDKLADPSVGQWLHALEGESDPIREAAVRNLGRGHGRAVKVPTRLVADIATASNVGFGAWMAAREANDFSLFQSALERLVELRREEIDCQGPAENPYDHLLEQYDPGSTTAQLKPMFARLRTELAQFIDTVSDAEGPKAVSGQWDVDSQKAFSNEVLSAIGFRLNDGRLDAAEHPFTVGMGPGDVRLTTHLYADDLLGGLTGTIHEAGHGMYEQGLPTAHAGTGVAAAAGMGLHESQSRFWENVIGRSLPFFQWLVPRIQRHFPDDTLTAEDWFGHANRVERSLIRVQADEATYNLHIIIRFELELALLNGELSVAELPDAWNAAYKDLLGITPESPAEGVLQDVHWSNGLFGYFPSYTIGNLYAASFRYQMESDVPDLWDRVASGDFGPVLSWLRDKVHRHGHVVDAPEIFRQAVGDRDPVADLMAHLNGRQGRLYGVG
jgi:carboxypeptidase Taq